MDFAREEIRELLDLRVEHAEVRVEGMERILQTEEPDVSAARTVAVSAGDVISEAVLAVRFGLSVQDVRPHAHP